MTDSQNESMNGASAGADIPATLATPNLLPGVVLPGATIGVMGGGQLGRMLGVKARQMGYRFHTLDPTNDCPAAQIADMQFTAEYDNTYQAKKFADSVDVVTFEFENVPSQILDLIGEIKPVAPGPEVLFTCRHRVQEKAFLSGNGIPVAPFSFCSSAKDVMMGLTEVGLPCILKTAEMGYDGKGQSLIREPHQAEMAWAEIDYPEAVLEGFVDFDYEASIIVARSRNGEIKTYPLVRNDHENHILDITTAPAGVKPATVTAAQDIAVKIAKVIDLVGVMCVELFVIATSDETEPDELIVNELAPRPHNSGHWTIDAATTDQFEQQLRAICGLPLGDTSVTRPAAMANLLGDLWFDPQTGERRDIPWDKALAMTGVKLHLYGKHEPRPGRKMGHLTALAPTPDEARQRVVAARAALYEGTTA